MKKILALCLVVILCFALVGCNNNEEPNVDVNNPNVEDNQNQGEVSGEINEDPDINDEEISGEEELPEVDPNSVAGKMTTITENANVQIRMGMQVEIPVEMSEAWLGLKADNYTTYVTETIMYESAISPANESICLIKVNDTAKVEELKKEIFDNCNPRKWVCMSAERVVVLSSGEYIMLAMASQDSCNALIPAFKAFFGEDTVGEILDKTVSESIENFEDLPGGGMAL